jgi:hypothetical protein
VRESEGCAINSVVGSACAMCRILARSLALFRISVGNGRSGRNWTAARVLTLHQAVLLPNNHTSPLNSPHTFLVFRNGSSYVDRLDQARCREAEHSCCWYVVCAMRLCAQLTSAIVRPDNTHRNRSLCPLRLRWSRLLFRHPRWPYSR